MDDDELEFDDIELCPVCGSIEVEYIHEGPDADRLFCPDCDEFI